MKRKALDSQEAKLYEGIDRAKGVFKVFARKFSFEYDAGYAHYFSALGLKPTGDLAAIRGAYRAIIKKYHPDVNKSLLSEEITREANEAYRFLSNYSMHSEGESLQRVVAVRAVKPARTIDFGFTRKRINANLGGKEKAGVPNPYG